MEQINKDEAVLFPCLEQPERVTLKCNEHFLWCLNRRGKMSTRKSARGENDEFQLIQTEEKDVIMLINHKIGRVLSLTKNPKTGVKEVRCLSEDSPFLESKAVTFTEEAKEQPRDDSYSTSRSSLGSSFSTASSSSDLTGIYESSTDAQLWRLRRSRGHFFLNNLETEDFVGIDDCGNLIISPSDSWPDSSCHWQIEPTTGELFFIENQELTSRLRCDLTGLLTMSSTHEMSEVFRFVRAGGSCVRISSWLYSHWVLVSDALGAIKMFRYDKLHEAENAWCSLWKVKKISSRGGVEIQSKTFGRSLCLASDERGKTSIESYHPVDKVFEEAEASTYFTNSKNSSRIRDQAVFLRQAIERKPSIHDQADFLRQAIERKPSIRKRLRWRWSWSSTRSINEEAESLTSTLQEGDGKSSSESTKRKDRTWRLQPAHSQKFFLTLMESIENAGNSIVGTFRIDLSQRVGSDNSTITISHLYHLESERYITCTQAGEISHVAESGKNEASEWTMENASVNGYSFKSRLYNFYLSCTEQEGEDQQNGFSLHHQCESKSDEGQCEEKIGEDAASTSCLKDFTTSKAVGHKETWNLSPCLPSELNEGGVILKEIVHDFTAGDKKILRAIGRTATVNVAVMVTALSGGSAGAAAFAAGGLITAKRFGDGVRTEDEKEIAKSLLVYGSATTASIAGQALTSVIMMGIGGATFPVVGAVAICVGCASGITAGALSEWGVDSALEEKQ